jgi:hypothetical protein
MKRQSNLGQSAIESHMYSTSVRRRTGPYTVVNSFFTCFKREV